MARALELNPNLTDAYVYRSIFLMLQERHEEALQDARHAMALDPLSHFVQDRMAQTLLWSGQMEAACQVYESMLVDEEDTWRIERCGSIAIAPCEVRDRRMLTWRVREREHRAEVLSGEHARERVGSVRRGRIRAPEHDALAGERVDVRCKPRPHSICPEGVHRHQQNRD